MLNIVIATTFSRKNPAFSETSQLKSRIILKMSKNSSDKSKKSNFSNTQNLSRNYSGMRTSSIKNRKKL